MNLSEFTKKAQIQICCQFMLADGEVDSSECERLFQIGKELNIEPQVTQRLLSYCSQLSIHQGKNNARDVIKQIQNILANDDSYDSDWNNKELRLQMLWTLINLGYADDEYSDAEKAVVDFLVRRWDIKQSELADMIDTAEAILALVKQKKWVQTISKPDETIKRITTELEENIQMMQDNIKTLISEADIVVKEGT